MTPRKNSSAQEDQSQNLELSSLKGSQNVDPADIPLSLLLSKTNSKLDRILMSMGSDKHSQTLNSSHIQDPQSQQDQNQPLFTPLKNSRGKVKKEDRDGKKFSEKMLIQIAHEEGNFGTARIFESVEQASDYQSEISSIATNPYFTKSQAGKLRKKTSSPSTKPKSLIGGKSPANPEKCSPSPKDPREFQTA